MEFQAENSIGLNISLFGKETIVQAEEIADLMLKLQNETRFVHILTRL